MTELQVFPCHGRTSPPLFQEECDTCLSAAVAQRDRHGIGFVVLVHSAGIKYSITNHQPEPARTMMPVHDRSSFENIYAGQPRWEIGRPQKAFLDVADQIAGSILDSGCGTGEIALYFAGRGHQVTGIDFLAEPINRSKQKAAERGMAATFMMMDALALKELPEVFDSVIDSGLFHVFSDEDRRRYVEGLASVLKPGGRLFLLCFSDAEPGDHGPRRVTRRELNDAFAEGWVIESLEPSQYEVRPDPKDISFLQGGPKAWFVVARKK